VEVGAGLLRRSERGRADASRTRVLVTGGAGFLGSHLRERLLAEGAVVLCVDNFFTGARRHIEHLIILILKLSDLRLPNRGARWT
jgi:nucleoside-diphosphate-sugar epimerase